MISCTCWPVTLYTHTPGHSRSSTPLHEGKLASWWHSRIGKVLQGKGYMLAGGSWNHSVRVCEHRGQTNRKQGFVFFTAPKDKLYCCFQQSRNVGPMVSNLLFWLGPLPESTITTWRSSHILTFFLSRRQRLPLGKRLVVFFSIDHPKRKLVKRTCKLPSFPEIWGLLPATRKLTFLQGLEGSFALLN